jgi:hypothetical protein
LKDKIIKLRSPCFKTRFWSTNNRVTMIVRIVFQKLFGIFFRIKSIRLRNFELGLDLPARSRTSIVRIFVRISFRHLICWFEDRNDDVSDESLRRSDVLLTSFNVIIIVVWIFKESNVVFRLWVRSRVKYLKYF